MLKKTGYSIITFLLIFLMSQTAFSQTTVVGSVPVNFSVNNGEVNYSLLIEIPPERNNNQPNLTLSYTGKGNGEMGMGWSLGGRSAIFRAPARLVPDGFIAGIDFSETDRFYIDGQRLIPINGGVNGGVNVEYRTEIDTYSQIISYGGTVNNPDYWVVKTKQGQVLTYGGDDNDPSNGGASLTFPTTLPDGASVPGGTTIWSVRTINDTTGNNPINYDYLVDQYTPYLDEITYTGGRVDLVYDSTRPDIQEKYFSGHKIVMNQRLTKIVVYANETNVHEYRINYDNSGFNSNSKIDSLEVCDCMSLKGFGQLSHIAKRRFQHTYTSFGFNLQASKHNFVCGEAA